jgi:ABC-2 type transport system permease protein
MSKFKTLFKKELKELITLQTVMPLVIMVIIFSFVGDLIGTEREKNQTRSYKIGIVDLDNTEESLRTIEILEDLNVSLISYPDINIDELEQYVDDEITTILKIPKGYGNKVKNLEPVKIDRFSIIRGISLLNLGGDNYVFNLIGNVSSVFSDEYLVEKGIDKSPNDLRNLILINSNIIINSKTANISQDALQGLVLSQSLLIPVIIFFLMIMAIQMIITSIVSEKENKTLETLLSCPVKRVTIVSTKILSAGMLSLIFACVYMVGMSNYLNGIIGAPLSSIDPNNVVANAMETLGIGMSTGDYILLGISLFISIIISLAAALILGTFVDDIKKAQGIVAPMIVMLLIPYVISIFIDINNASVFIKLLVYLIPFSHSFMASKNLIFNDNSIVFFGIIYQLFVLIILIIIAAKIFSTDRILTMKLNFKKNKF